MSTIEVETVLIILDSVLGPGWSEHRDPGILTLVKTGTHSVAFNSLALYIHHLVREFGQSDSIIIRVQLFRVLRHVLAKLLAAGYVHAKAARSSPQSVTTTSEVEPTLEEGIVKVYQTTVGRTPVEAEIDAWKKNIDNGLPFYQFLLRMGRTEEAKRQASSRMVLENVTDGECVQLVYELVLGRGAATWEIDRWLQKLEAGTITRRQMLTDLFNHGAQQAAKPAEAPARDGLSCRIMGTSHFLTVADWKRQTKELIGKPTAPDKRYANRFHVRRTSQVLVSALTSLYRGENFIEQFMDNITSQSGFDDYCELVIVDADSPENEYETIKRYLDKHKNINYIRVNHRIGIYDAWNVAARAARGEYLTNTNVDDLRRHDSFEIQAGVLENLPFVDVVYQELYYTLDPRLPFERIAAFGHETQLPIITPHNMMKFNSPHNAPMWRKCLHEELGWFDTRYQSAGDLEFWLRCTVADKVFYKINVPHIAYYQNPEGLSTRSNTRGISETMDIYKTYCRKLAPEAAIMPSVEFVRRLGMVSPGPAAHNRYAMAQQALHGLAQRGKFLRYASGQA
ncbi:MAG: DUF4214 domain-containing protein [Gammaproteobacteria bacterium]|nr:DUF4214 domain-containing protein [Gammaproteobacteria bacterium]NNJ85475.1 DUF4214 domain-containing protein [Gammaproteobacteria bacterium]